jgi:hypothetical protein
LLQDADALVRRNFMVRYALILFWVAVCTAVSYAQMNQPDSVTQSWNEVEITIPLLKGIDGAGKKVDRLNAVVNGIFRTSRTSHIDDKRAGFGLTLRINKHFSLYGALLYRRDEIVKFVPHVEKRLDVGGTFSTTWKKFTIRDRNLYEHRYRNGRVNTDFYRQRFQISHPLNHDGKTLFSPFISEEVYYEIHAQKWVQSEFYAGISRRFNKWSVLEIAYIRNDVKPFNNNGLSLTLRVHL